MTKAIGRYNELEYEVEIDGEIVYTAGNSSIDSQAYVNTDDGVGLNTMRDYCNQTTQQIAGEHDAEFMGIEYLER